MYGRQHVVYNVHNLIHISSDVAKFGDLDACSAFPFQKYMQTIIRFVWKPEFPIEQVVCCINETKFINCQSEGVTSLPCQPRLLSPGLKKMSQEWTYPIRITYI